MKIAVACDHAGFSYKESIMNQVKTLGHEVIDLGTNSTDSVDYPDFGAAAGREVASGRAKLGIVICGSGVGISIAANKIDGVRCALCHDHLTAALCRQHNDANIVSIGARLTGIDVALDIVRTFLSTEFEGGRHQGRIDKLTALEK